MINYEKYYVDQVGAGLPVYRGIQHQRGFGGIGNVLGGLFRSSTPILESGAKYLAKKAINMGTGILGDVVRGRNIKKAVKRRYGQAKSKVSEDIGSLFLRAARREPSAKKRRVVLPPRKKSNKKVNRRKLNRRRLAKGVRTLPRERDIFG